MRTDETVVSNEIHRGRTGAGLSLRVTAQAAGVHHVRLWRFEHGDLNALNLEEIGAVGAVVGLDVRLRAYPAGDPIRDAGQQRLLERLRCVVAPDLHWATEVPLPADLDRRAWDAEIAGASWRMVVEAETVLRDVQALERRFNLKSADGGAALVLLVVSDTERNRRALRAAPTAFEPLRRDARSVLRALRAGERPPASAILFL